MSNNEEQNDAKSPWIWKAAIVALPVGLALSAAIAVGLKISQGAKTGMEGVTYSATEFSASNLRDAANKAENSIGKRDFETPEGQITMQQMISFITGSLSSINLGYKVQSDEGMTTGGRIWKSYWVDSTEKGDDGAVLVWCEYSDEQNSASVAALLSVAEWLRGRVFERQVRVAFLKDEEGLPGVTSNLSQDEDEIHFHVSGLGQGSRGLMKTGGPLKADRELAFYRLEGKGGERSASDWKMTADWESFEEQVRELCKEISETAGEKVVLQK
ncbi:MAG: hypothetical protein ACSHYB_18070 [Roseibacillus sp.]